MTWQETWQHQQDKRNWFKQSSQRPMDWAVYIHDFENYGRYGKIVFSYVMLFIFSSILFWNALKYYLIFKERSMHWAVYIHDFENYRQYGKDVFSNVIYSPSHIFCLIFYFEMPQNIILFLKIKVINLLIFLLYPY